MYETSKESTIWGYRLDEEQIVVTLCIINLKVKSVGASVPSFVSKGSSKLQMIGIIKLTTLSAFLN